MLSKDMVTILNYLNDTKRYDVISGIRIIHLLQYLNISSLKFHNATEGLLKDGYILKENMSMFITEKGISECKKQVK